MGVSTGEDTTVYIFPGDPEEYFVIYNMNGISGNAFFENKFLLNADPSFSEEHLKYTVTHEYHHTVYMTYLDDPYSYKILDYVLLEGKADAFANILYPETEIRWTEPMTEGEETTVLELLSEYVDSTNWEMYDHFFKGNYAKGLPHWSNYKIGYQIIQSFIQNNPEISVLEWTIMDAKEIVKNSDYSHLVE